jgi:ABC-type multidrug transport system fused ATPase/permease subunit
MRESANSFAWTIWRLFQRDASLNEKIRFIQDYYSLLALKAEIVDGYIPYPAPECMELEGMKVEFKNVSMKYPKSTNFALKNVSFTIPAGSTVILVGTNGSGKTTTVSLLSRLLDATSGEILIDDRPIKDYEIFPLRDAQAILRQNYQHFPFSVKENIGMGDPRWLKDDNALGNAEERIKRAAKLGGADEIIEEIKGLDEKRGEVFKNVLTDEKEATAKGSGEKEDTASEDSWNIKVTPVVTWVGSFQLHGSKLSDMSEEVEKKLELSGGQWQRLALARMFMRAERDQVRLVCTDEPSAALDPRAEFGKPRSCVYPVV